MSDALFFDEFGEDREREFQSMGITLEVRKKREETVIREIFDVFLKMNL